MARRELRIVPYNGEREYQYYLDGLKVNGKRQRLFFKDLKEATEELKKRKKQIRKEGEDGQAISADLRVLAGKCEQRLAPFGKTIWDATEFYIAHLETQRSVLPVSVLSTEYQHSKERAGLSAKHIGDIRQRLKRFQADYGERDIKSIEPRELENWLHSLGLSPQSLNNFRTVVSGLFEHAVKRDLLGRNPMRAVARVKAVDKAPAIFTPDQLEKLLQAAPSDLLPALAVQAFAGVRTAEILRMEWSEIDLVPQRHQPYGCLKVTATKSKTAKRRVIPIASNLADWLRPYAAKTGRIWSKKISAYHIAIRELLPQAELKEWPDNGLRHSFASYYLAEHHDASKLALEMGHTSARMIFDAYREVVRPEEAERYWQVAPKSKPKNVISMKGAR
jgi:integrase